MNVWRPASVLVGSLLLCVAFTSGGCASATPKLKVRTVVDPEAQFGSYRSYGFVAQPGTNEGSGKATAMTIYFMQGVRHEMDSRGYRYTEESPDLLVNFNVQARANDSQTNVSPTYGYSTGYYAYRAGLYGLPVVTSEVQENVSYRVGTGNVDVVDARRKVLVWEGIAEGRISEDMLANPGPAIGEVIAEMFEQYPGKAPP